jgi:hypothetical protein
VIRKLTIPVHERVLALYKIRKLKVIKKAVRLLAAVVSSRVPWFNPKLNKVTVWQFLPNYSTEAP